MGHKSPISGTHKSSLEALVGETVHAFFPLLLQVHPNIASVRFRTYKPEPRLSDRLRNQLSVDEKQIRDKAQDVCHENGIPYWDAVLGIAMKKHPIPMRLIDVALQHSPSPQEDIYELLADELSIQRILEITETIPNGMGLSFSSNIQMNDGSHLYLPMIDFRCPCSKENIKAIQRMLTIVYGGSGILVESGQSYHFYGLTLLPHEAWISFLGRALLFSPFTDPRYVAHRLVDGEGRLKVYDGVKKFIPRVIDVVFPDNG